MKPLQTLLLLFLMALPDTLRAQFIFTTNNDAITIRGYRGTNGIAVIPGTINGYLVTSIGPHAFDPLYNGSLFLVTNVTIPNSVTNIEVSAFQQCSSLSNLVLGSGLMSIKATAFYACASLTSVTIPNSVITLGTSAFESCSKLMSLTLGTSMASIGTSAFSGCGSLTNIFLPATTTNIGPYAFYHCTNVAAITVAAQNPVYSSVGGVLFDKTQMALLQFPGGRAGSYAIPTNVVSIGNGFWNCVNLTDTSIPGSVTNMSAGPFSGCASLNAIAVAAQNPLYSSVGGVLFDKTQTTLIQFPGGRAGSYTIPSGVTSIDTQAFAFSGPLTGLIVPASMNNLGHFAFEECYNLAGIFFQGNAPANLGTYVFYDDHNTTAYYLPGTTSWSSTFGGLPTATWSLPIPLILNNGSGFGVQPNGFSFTISWATNASVVVEACADLSNPLWQPVQTNALVDGTFYYSDPEWVNYPDRFYRLRSP